MCPAYYFLLLVNLVQSPNGLYLPMPKSSRGQFKLESIILIILKAESFSCCSRLHCGRPGGDSEISLLPPTEMQKIMTCIHKIYVVHQQDRLLLSQLRLTFPSSMDGVRSRNRSKLPRPSELDNRTPPATTNRAQFGT